METKLFLNQCSQHLLCYPFSYSDRLLCSDTTFLWSGVTPSLFAVGHMATCSAPGTQQMTKKSVCLDQFLTKFVVHLNSLLVPPQELAEQRMSFCKKKKQLFSADMPTWRISSEALFSGTFLSENRLLSSFDSTKVNTFNADTSDLTQRHLLTNLPE